MSDRLLTAARRLVTTLKACAKCGGAATHSDGDHHYYCDAHANLADAGCDESDGIEFCEFRNANEIRELIAAISTEPA